MIRRRARRHAVVGRTQAIAVLAALWPVVLAGTVCAPLAAGAPGAVSFVQVRIDRVTPDVVTTSSDPVVTVAGTVTNVGDRPVRDVMVRLEQAAAVTSSAGLRSELGGATDQFQPVADFITVAPELQRGQDVRFTLSASIRAVDQPALDLESPGVYPVLVNVNGTPDYGAPARLDDARFLLPVTGLPKDSGAAAGDPVTTVVAPDTSEPVRITMLWPLADRPRLAPGVPGGTLPVRLSDDDLAASLSPGGRLDVLLSSVEFATTPEIDPDGLVTRSLCLALDPDLLVTVNAMVNGYVVADPGAAVRPGTGQAAATAWLARLRALAHHVCVAPVPYAQADLTALHRVDDPGLSAIAVRSPGDIIDRILGVLSVRGVTLLADGPLTGDATEMLGAQGGSVVIAAGDCAADEAAASSAADVTPRRVSPQVAVAPFDPAVGAALAAVGADPVSPSYLDAALSVPLRHDSAVARRQDALGSMLWRALEPPGTLAVPRSQLLLPPSYWNPHVDDAQAILTTLATAIRSGLAMPEPLTAVIAAGRTAGAGPLPTHPGGQSGQFDDDVIGTVAGQSGRLWALTAALTTDARTGLTGEQYTAPLHEDMLRALSQSQPVDVRNELAAERLAVVAATVDDLFGAVTIVNPAGSYTLATEHSPLPLALRNDLGVPIRVRLQVDAPPGMTVTDIGEIELPPGYLPLLVPVEVHFNQRVAVDVALLTPDGLSLGEPVRLSVHSNAYGLVLFLITTTAATALAVLAGRRLWHRFRGKPDRADLDRPDPVATAEAFAAAPPDPGGRA